MADSTFVTILPALKAVDNGDGTYSVSAVLVPVGGGSDTVFAGISPPLKAHDNGDGSFAVSCYQV